MDKVKSVLLTRESGLAQSFFRGKGKDRWLLICCGDDGNVVSLSGDEVMDAYLLKILETAINQEISKRNIFDKQQEGP